MTRPLAKPAKPVPQRDLFQFDSPLTREMRGERPLMAFPFFALSKNACMKPFSYEHANVSIEVRPSANGVATIYDKEIVLYIASLMAAKIEARDEGRRISSLPRTTCSRSPAPTIRRVPMPGCPRRWSGCRGRGSRPISRQAVMARRACSPGCRRRGCIIRAPAPASAG